MALPKISTPVYELTLPLSGKNIKFRPFLVKEYKNLMMAKEADDYDTIMRNVKQVLINCTLDDINIDDVPIVDIEYYFLNLRARSSGEIIELRYICNNEIDDIECGNVMDTSINLLDIGVTNFNKDDSLIKISDSILIKLSYPKFSTLKSIETTDDLTDLAIKIIADSVEYIFDGEQYYYANETDPNELIAFIESLSQEQFSKIEDFFAHLPKLNKIVPIVCSKCGFNHTIDVEGLESFFD